MARSHWIFLCRNGDGKEEGICHTHKLQSFSSGTISPRLICLWEMEKKHEVVRNGIIYSPRISLSSCHYLAGTCALKLEGFWGACAKSWRKLCCLWQGFNFTTRQSEHNVIVSGQRVPIILKDVIINESVSTLPLLACRQASEKHLMDFGDGFPLLCDRCLPFPACCSLPAPFCLLPFSRQSRHISPHLIFVPHSRSVTFFLHSVLCVFSSLYQIHLLFEMHTFSLSLS